MATASLSKRQTDILDGIGSFARENDFPPTVRDIQKICNISSTSVVDYNLKILEKQGFISRRKDIARGIELLDGKDASNSFKTTRIPVLGKIAAGFPLPVFGDVLADVESAEYIDLPPGQKHQDLLYGLRVEGTSMIDSCIDDGDVVIIKSGPQAENGQTVVAWLVQEEEATLKKIYFHPHGVIRLQPSNSTMAPIFVAADNISIRGTVVSVVRQYT
jgi:repressor LexA